ncbi:unnamed protein product [Adineta steineri]|uniref:BZIP domain-containing protein n=1 Tax=Adineta steineri TaxID=433720 RepID=A0A814QT99_9BILA|nr:unnamed protein product [Adineta steineri]CAF3791113.1 unnamed protein product [Adineta steineri]
MSFSLKREKILSNNCIYYGPIRFYGRRRKAPTLSTGRRSKFEEVNEEEEIRRNKRREKNRLLSKRLKEKREKILNELIQQINQLEEKQFYLQNTVEQLHSHRNQLINKLSNANKDPLLNLIYQNDVPLFFQQVDDLQFDTDSLIITFTDEHSSLDEFIYNCDQE